MAVTVCVRVGCSKALPDIAVKNGDRYHSRQCCELVTMAADVTPGGARMTGDITRQRTLGGVAVPGTRLQREAAARSLEAEARVGREDKARKARERKATW